MRSGTGHRQQETKYKQRTVMVWMRTPYLSAAVLPGVNGCITVSFIRLRELAEKDHI